MIDQLISCHGRIRGMTSLALRVASSAPATEAEVADAAKAVHRYFTIALHRHAQDEDESIRPRLIAVSAPADVQRTLATMAAEHPPIEAVIAEVAPSWKALVTEPGMLADLRLKLGRAAQRIDELFRLHLPPEEAIVFPAMRRLLTPEVLAEILVELKERRAVAE